MTSVTRHFSPWHLWTAAAAWLTFSVWTLWIVLVGLDDAADKPLTIALATAGTLLGPMTGAISRGLQACCLRFSLMLLPYALGCLIVAALVQITLAPTRSWRRIVRVIAWLAGLMVWFGSGIVSFGHALS